MEDISVFGFRLTPAAFRWLIVGAGAVAMAYQLGTKTYPEVQDYTALRAKIAEKQEVLARARTTMADRPQLEASLKRDQGRVDELRGRIPPRSQVLSVLLVDLTRIFRQTGNHMVAFTPSAFASLGKGGSLSDVGKIGIQIQAEGTYPQAIALFEHLARYEHVLAVDGPVFTPAAEKDGRNVLTYTFSLTTYALDQ